MIRVHPMTAQFTDARVAERVIRYDARNRCLVPEVGKRDRDIRFSPAAEGPL